MNNIKSLAKKWYSAIAFPKEYDSLIDKVINRDDINDELLDKTCEDLEKIGDKELCLVYALAKCEELEKKYIDKGISKNIFSDTIADIKIWTLDYYNRTNILGLDQIMWISYHLNFALFKLGRLQFNFSPSLIDCPEKNLKKGDNTLGVHITRNEPFSPETWAPSFAMARDFFPKYFPEYEYTYFSCSSWFLSPDLDIILDESSNIVKFKKLFDIISVDEKDIMLYFVFGWGTKIEDLENVEAKTSLQRKVKEYVSSGNKLHSGYGVIKK